MEFGWGPQDNGLFHPTDDRMLDHLGGAPRPGAGSLRMRHKRKRAREPRGRRRLKKKGEREALPPHQNRLNFAGKSPSPYGDVGVEPSRTPSVLRKSRSATPVQRPLPSRSVTPVQMPLTSQERFERSRSRYKREARATSAGSPGKKRQYKADFEVMKERYRDYSAPRFDPIGNVSSAGPQSREAMKREIRHRAKHGYDATVARRGEKPRPRKRKAEKPLAPLDAPMDEPVVHPAGLLAPTGPVPPRASYVRESLDDMRKRYKAEMGTKEPTPEELSAPIAKPAALRKELVKPKRVVEGLGAAGLAQMQQMFDVRGAEEFHEQQEAE